MATLLTSGRTFDTNTPGTVFLDNGATNFGVGARYKGNTSFTMSGTKKSINLEFDWKDTNADLMTYQTVNLNNAAADETIMREALYFNVMSQYTPCPQGAMCRVHINGALWGVYSLVQQENTQLIKEWFPSASGDRWRAPNAPSGGEGSPVPIPPSPISARTSRITSINTHSRQITWPLTSHGHGWPTRLGL